MELKELRTDLIELLMKYVHDLDGVNIEDVKKACTETIDWFYGTEE